MIRTAVTVILLGPAVEFYREAQIWWPVVTAWSTDVLRGLKEALH